MPSFHRVSSTLDISSVLMEIEDNRHLFGELNARKGDKGSPHHQMDDIWVRYGDIRGMVESGDYTGIADEHDSIWLKDMPAVRRICFDLMSMVDGERLGGVLITRLPPGGEIKPHTDSGWHAGYYSKYYVPIKNELGSVFGFECGDIKAVAGEVWEFNNSAPHWVNNYSGSERIAMIVCIKKGVF